MKNKRGRPKTRTHGTVAMYNAGCKCKHCMQAYREYSRNRRATDKEFKHSFKEDEIILTTLKFKEVERGKWVRV